MGFAEDTKRGFINTFCIFKEVKKKKKEPAEERKGKYILNK